VAERNWHRTENAQKGIGPVLLRGSGGSLDPAFIGYQADDGRWLDTENREIHPVYFCAIPQFDATDDGAGS
jgi:hypothetical protein